MAVSKDRFKRARALGYRSGLEVKNAAHFEAHGFPVHYEAARVKYTVPARIASYSPDFPMTWNGIVIETKGVFSTSDRQKHILLKNEHPDLEIRFVFSNPNSRISKQSSTTYSAWCDKHGFQYAKSLVPVAWMKEPPEAKRMSAMRDLLGL